VLDPSCRGMGLLLSWHSKFMIAALPLMVWELGMHAASDCIAAG